MTEIWGMLQVRTGTGSEITTCANLSGDLLADASNSYRHMSENKDAR